MNTGNFGRTVLLVVVGLIVVGMIGWWLVKALFGFAFFLIIGALIVAGGFYVYGRAKNMLGGRPRRRIDRR